MVIFPNAMDPNEVSALIGNLAAPHILVIGAYTGGEVAAFRATMPRCEVWALEPDPRPAKRFRERYAGDVMVHLHEVAAGAVTGLVTWYASHGHQLSSADWDASSSIKEPTNHLSHFPEVTFTKDGYQVNCVRLDDLFDNRSFDFIWGDVQGAQREVIIGGRHIFDVTHYVYMELHDPPMYQGEPTFQELCDLLPGHAPVSKHGHNFLFVKKL